MHIEIVKAVAQPGLQCPGGIVRDEARGSTVMLVEILDDDARFRHGLVPRIVAQHRKLADPPQLHQRGALGQIAEIDLVRRERNVVLVQGDQRLPAIRGQRVEMQGERHRKTPYFAAAGTQRRITMPVDIGRLSISFSLSFWPGLNSGVPPPRRIGFMAMRNSSINPCGIRLAARSALPNRKISLALSRFSLATVSETSSPNICVLFQSDFCTVRENTYFGAVTRPNSNPPAAFNCSIDNFSSSSPQTS